MSDPSSSPPSPVGSPPLILAFLAIGIFSAAMIAVFGWRRVQFGRDFGHHRAGGARATRMRGSDATDNAREGAGCSKLGEKPVLWEVWVDRGSKADNVDYGCWESVMPLAVLSSPQGTSARACTTSTTPSHITSNNLPLTPPTRSPIPRPRRTPPSLFPLHLRTGNATGNPLTSTDTNRHGTREPGSREMEAVERKIAQVVIIVEMPSLASSRRRHHLPPQCSEHQRSLSIRSGSETLVESHDKMRENLLGMDYNGGEFQYSIGVHNSPWPVSTKSDPDTTATRISQLSDKKVLT